MSRVAEVRPVYVSYCAECADGDGPHDEPEVAEAWTAAHNAEYHAPPAPDRLADTWDEAIAAAAKSLEDAVEYQWNGTPRKPSNFKRAGRYISNGIRNPYRKADS